MILINFRKKKFDKKNISGKKTIERSLFQAQSFQLSLKESVFFFTQKEKTTRRYNKK
jgi:hypothetical protein